MELKNNIDTQQLLYVFSGGEDMFKELYEDNKRNPRAETVKEIIKSFNWVRHKLGFNFWSNEYSNVDTLNKNISNVASLELEAMYNTLLSIKNNCIPVHISTNDEEINNALIDWNDVPEGFTAFEFNNGVINIEVKKIKGELYFRDLGSNKSFSLGVTPEDSGEIEAFQYMLNPFYKPHVTESGDFIIHEGQGEITYLNKNWVNENPEKSRALLSWLNKKIGDL